MFPKIQLDGFSLDACRHLARASKAAYLTPGEISPLLCAEGAELVAFIEDAATDTQCFIARRRNDLLVVFRGSKEIKDWITDAKFRRTDWCGLSVHRGFAAGFNSVWSRIADALSPWRLRGNIWFSGHSLGAAQCKLAAFRAYENNFNIAGVYTFGCPRVGGADFAAEYNSRLKKITFDIGYQLDIVRRLPFALPHFVPCYQSGYRHCGTDVFIDAFGQVQVDLPWWNKIPSDFAGLGEEFSVVLPYRHLGKLLRDHYMERYHDLLIK